jgi:streptomycin 6-kinase
MQRLEHVAREVAEEWGLTLGPPFALSRYAYVAPAGEDAVLKVVPPEDDESDNDADALALWNGDGAVRLLRHDPERRALLLERARPGVDASTVPEEEATAIAVAVGPKLWRPAGAPFRSIRDFVPRWLSTVAPTRHELVPVAERVLAELEFRDDTLIHGDFHHHNLLRHGDRWLAVDSKAMRGEPEFDVPSFLWNPLGTTPTRARTERRIAAFAAAGLDEERIRSWTIVRGVYLGLPLTRDGREGAALQVVRMLL